MQEKMHHLIHGKGDLPGQPMQVCKSCSHNLHNQEQPVFSDREARDEDERAIAAEREELRQFLAEYEAYLDRYAAGTSDPTPSDFAKLTSY